MKSDATEGALGFLAMARGSKSDAVPLDEPEKSPSDEELLSRIQRGDNSALGLLFERYARVVLAVGYRVLRDRSEAEEVLQNTFLYVSKKAALFDPQKGSAKNWLLQVAYHRSLDRRVSLNKQSLSGGTKLEEIEDYSKNGIDIEQELGQRYDAELLRKAFLELSDKQRATLELFFFHGMTLRQVAERLGEPLENVRHYYYRALRKLRNSTALEVLRKERDHES